ncbi:dihydrofolate reductase family protein [Haloglomus litoreum]|uniref:dihydrofolate reductase family protein n=1 Tax=Haloglomus litoreum TaxID=3034026 RepID=UPI0023E75665|nr:dihydrofolate reductase family protein [Haloglomus sp. DT116]
MDSEGVTLYVATSVDGYIADADGGVGWLDEIAEDAPADEVSSYEAFFETVDCLVMGSRTYEQILGFGEWPYGDRPTYVTTGRDLPLATDQVELVDRALAPLVDDLGERHGHVWLVGGAALAQAFLREGLVDELRLALVPTVLGDGIGLFDGETGAHDLTLLDSSRYAAGLVEVRYAVSG